MSKSQAANRSTDAQVFELLASWSIHVDLWTKNKNPKLLTLRYEDMLERPVDAFGKVIKFLGDQPNAERLTQAIEFSSFKSLSTQETEHGYAANAPNSAAPFFREGRAGNGVKF